MSTAIVPLEDDVGDVLEKAMKWSGLTVEQVAASANIAQSRILDAIDYRSDLTPVELCRLSAVLHLNDVGLCALGNQSYPIPACPGLPFVVHPLRMSHGVGVANAYVVSAPGSSHGILFDTGPNLVALLQDWPVTIKHIDAVFLTHIEGEHTGGLCDVVDYFGITRAYVPEGCQAPCGDAFTEGETRQWDPFSVQAYSTPGHASAHNCYRVISMRTSAKPVELLIAGDLIFAGSVGGSYFSGRVHQEQLARIVGLCAKNTVIAAGHGPLTTLAHERRFNPFLV
ncbi:MAG: MBL fold metallo-hydrolase [Cephaloticoccus sp.]|nr:MBL fold metallo-hydrolase [Cephaloticoccus sp.]